ncbi:MAG: amino acid ABC transporter permease [Acidimicrobiia bacterium]|nr:amino acid ABC transporter permease [Acidimicrobiia bacterium]
MEQMTPPQTAELAPEKPRSGPWAWCRENLFAGDTWGPIAFNAFLTVAFVLIVLNLMGFVTTYLFAAERRWAAVTYNMKLLMVQAFPQDDLIRIWVSIGIFAVLVVWSLASWEFGGQISVEKMAQGVRAAFVLVFLTGIMHHGEGAAGFGLPFLRFDNPADWSSIRAWIVLASLAGAVAAHFFAQAAHRRESEQTVPILVVPVLGMALVTLALWTVWLPVPEGQFDETTARIATTTARPWTILFGVTILAYFVGIFLHRQRPKLMRRVLISAWILSYPIIIFVIQRDPILDWADILGFGETPFLSSDLGTLLIFGILGSVVIWVVGLPPNRAVTGATVGILGLIVGLMSFAFGDGPLWSTVLMAAIGLALVAAAITIHEPVEMVRAAGAGLAMLALIIWFVPMPFVYRTFMVALALALLSAPVFGGTEQGRANLVRAWIPISFLIVGAFLLGGSDTSLEFQSTTFLGGFNLTILLAISGLALSLPAGLVLALARTSSLPIFRLLATGYIELVRSIPMITWLFFGSAMLTAFLPSGVEFDEIVRVVAAIAIFNSAYVAENIRGGLQAINKGQYEAARAVGLSVVQSTSLVILPQAIRTVIPALVGSIIIAFKDTSLVAIIGLADVLLIARNFVPQQSDPNFQGTLTQMMFFMALFYWVFTFTISRLALRYEKSIGLGER